MKKLIFVLFLVNAALWSIPAHALAIALDDDGFTYVTCDTCVTPSMWTGSTNDIHINDLNVDGHYDGIKANLGATEIEIILGIAEGTLLSLYKSDGPTSPDGGGDYVGVDSGTFAASYNTTFTESGSDPANSTTYYTGIDDKIVCGTCFLYVKDGGNDPFWYVFNISLWDGGNIDLSNFWDGTVENGAISHVEIFNYDGTRGPCPDGNCATVPEPSISALLGIGLLGMIGVSRRRKV